MKKLFTIFCAGILTLGVSAQAQFGATAGLNMSNITGYNESIGMKMGTYVGVSASIPFSYAMSLKTGAIYSIKGDNFENDVRKSSRNLSYIEVPLNLSFSVSDQMSLMAGPYIGFLIGDSGADLQVTPSGGDGDIIFDQADYPNEDTRAMDFGINLGAGFAVTEAISINAGYQMGLASLDPDGDAKNSNIHIGMTYSFGGGYY
jgi:opacity protein-like surface antigen